MSEPLVIVIRGARHCIQDCGVCGVVHTVPEAMKAHFQESGGFWHCPNGHRWGYLTGRKEQDRIRQERDLFKQQLAQRDDEARELRERAEIAFATATKERAARQRIEKRISHGVCPDCNRTIKNMARHMASKHPKRVCEVVPIKAIP